MKKFLALLLVIPAFFLGACAQTPPTITPAPVTVTETAQPQMTTEQKFVEFIQQRPYFSTVPAAQLVETAKSVCRAFDAGQSLAAVGNAAIQAGLPAYEAGYFIGASVVAFCPQYKNIADDGI